MEAEYSATIKIDGTEISDWTGFSIDRRLGQGEASFNIDISRPIETNAGSTITITESYGGSSVDLIKDKLIEVSGTGLQQGSIRGSGAPITNYAPIKSLIFVNQTWLKKRFPYYVLKNGIIYRSDPGNSNYKIHGVSPTRLFLDELPGKNVRDVEFECIVENNLSYRRIATLLANKVLDSTNTYNYNIKTNVFDIKLQKVFTVSAGETYFQAIMRLFKDFRPFVTIEGNTINIMDVGGANQGRPVGSGLINLSEDSFSLYQYNQQINYDIIDNVLVVGPSLNFTSSYYKTSFKKTLSSKSLVGQTIETTSSETHTIEGGTNYYELGRPSDGVIKQTIRRTKMLVDMNSGDTAVTREEVYVYSDSGLEQKVITDYEYADYGTPTKSTVEEYARMPVVGSGYEEQYVSDSVSNVATYKPTSFEFKMVSRTITKFSTLVEDLGISEYDKYIYRDVIYYQDKVRKDGTDYTLRSTVYSRQDAHRMGIPYYEEAISSDTGWRNVLELDEHEMVRVETISNSLMRKNITYTKYHPMRTCLYKSEDIPLKKKKVQDVIEKRWLFINQNGAVRLFDEDTPLPTNLKLHPRVVINCPDITTQYLAEMVARRAMASKPSSIVEASVRTVVPIFGLTPGQSIKIPNCTKEYFDYNITSFKSIIIPGGTYWIVGTSRKVKFTGGWNTNVRTFEVYDEIELRDRY